MAIRRRKARKAKKAVRKFAGRRRLANGPGRGLAATRVRDGDSGLGSTSLVVRPWCRFVKSTFPPSMVFHEKYADIERTISVTTGGIANNSFLYRLNDIFDPYYSIGGGGPPEWYTTLASIYQRYIVWSVDADIRFFDPTQNTLLGAVLLQCADDTDDPAAKTADYFLQRRNYATAQLTSTTGEGSFRQIQEHIKLWTVEGLPFRQYVDQMSVYGAQMGADPGKSPLFRIAVADLDGQNTGSCKVQVSLTFHGKAYGLKQS